MTAAFEPAELLAAALSALFLAVPLAVVVAGGVLAVPRRMVSAPGLGIGIGLLAGVVLAVVSIVARSEEHTSELQSRGHLVCRLLLEKKKTPPPAHPTP